MRIRKLEINGFKSFPDRTVVQFGPGVSCVVGPNGSGKSNILDAIRWVIGEMSARALRGGEMLDVIFAGSADRPPVGYAEVAMTLAAEEGEPFPGEFARLTELQVGRRLHRSGASEYFINQARCRRRDIVELFLDTGVGSDLYCFIEQGSVGKVVHATPAERRTLIEEAAGISRYKARREEAQGRLAATAVQLDRAADVAEEMGRRLRMLEGQVLQVARYRRLRARVRQQEILLALARYADLAAERRRLRQAAREARHRAEEAERQVLRRQTEVDTRREEVEVVEAAASAWRDEAGEQDARIREHESTLGFAARREEELRAAAVQGEAEAEALVAREAARAEEEATRTREVADLDAALERATAEVAAAAHAESEASASARASREAAAAAEQAAAAGAVEVEAARARRAALEERLAAWPAEAARREEAVETARAAVGDLEEAVAAARARAEAARRAHDGAREQAVRAVPVARRARETWEAAEARLAGVEARARAAREEEVAPLAAAEAAARDAEAAVDAGAVERGEAPTVVAARTEGEEALAAARDAASSAHAAASARAEAWLQALEEAEAAALARARTLVRARLEALADDGARAEAEAEAAAAEALATATREAAEQAATRLSAAERAREDAWAALDAARARREAVQDDLATLARRRAEVEGLLAGLAERDRPSADLGALVGERPTLLDRLRAVGASPDDLAALGDRALLPVFDRAAEVLALAADLGESPARVAWMARPAGEGEILPGTALVADLAAALEHHRRTGGAAAVQGTGERVDADGTVTLGRPGVEVRAAAARREETERLQAEAADLGARAEALEADREAAATVEALARRSAEEADAARTEVEQEVRAERETVEAEVRRAGAAAVVAARRDAAAAVEAARAEGEGEVARVREGFAARRLAARRTASRALEAVRVEAEAAVAAARAKAEARVTEAAREAEAAARAAREAARHTLAEARDDVRARRETLEAVERRDREAVAEASAARDAAREASSRAEEAAREASAAQARTEVDQVRVDGEVRALLARQEAAQSALRAAVAERAAMDRERERIEQERAEAGRALEATVARTAGGPDLPALRAAREDAEATEAEVRATHAAAVQHRADLVARRAAKAEAVEALRRARSDLVERQQAAATRLEEIAAASAENDARRATADAALAEARTARTAAWDRLQRERARLEGLREQLRALEEEVRAHATARDEAQREAGDLDVRLREVQVEVDDLRRRMDERYLVSLPGLLDRLDAHGVVLLETDDPARSDVEIGGRVVAGVPDLEVRPGMLQDFDGIAALVEEVETSRRRLLSLGEVNLAAAEEYEDVARRHADLVAQRTDLEEAMDRIRAAIAKMNRTCRERFRETFDRVAGNLEALYPRLTGGGRARLSLTDEEDLLETGIEIFVQPSGKRLQKLGLLSGGEKAMTAIALLLSLFQVKPSPFCVLDEVDAPLDEANGGRFNEVLREMANLAQFIVITHNRKTMEAADTLYGITMPTPGVSRLVSVRLGA